MYAVLHEDAVRADAGLAGVAELTRHNAGNRQIEIGIVEDDKWGIAAKLKAEAFDRAGALFHQ